LPAGRQWQARFSTRARTTATTQDAMEREWVRREARYASTATKPCPPLHRKKVQNGGDRRKRRRYGRATVPTYSTNFFQGKSLSRKILWKCIYII
jgi:hypothetical protein